MVSHTYSFRIIYMIDFESVCYVFLQDQIFPGGKVQRGVISTINIWGVGVGVCVCEPSHPKYYYFLKKEGNR